MKPIQERYNNLSLVDRNAYEQIIDRRRQSMIGLPGAFIRVLIELGLLFIITSYILGIDISLFSPVYASLVGLTAYFIVGSFFVIIIIAIINRIMINKLKKRILFM